MQRRSYPILLAAFVLPMAVPVSHLGSVRAAEQSEAERFFESRIRPLLSKHCYSCHSAKAAANKKLKGGLQLDSRESTLRGGDSGPVLVPGKPQDSLLLKALRYEDLEMPPSGKLPNGVVADFEKWVKAGAHWPGDGNSATPNSPAKTDYAAWRKSHWAWKPLNKSRPPLSADDDWSKGDIDRYVWAQLRGANLRPSNEADRRVLFRRLHQDITGLPATFEATNRFANDKRPDAYERVVDRLLADPSYGEKWGRHWLDIARYADNGGFNSQTKELYTNFPYAYTYRDYVIRAWNEDLPYDRFIIEQIAADKLPKSEDNRRLAALGFLSLGDKSFGTSSADRVDDCIDTVTRGLMGITISCARCHDHKYDPIPTEDYYSLFSVFQNTTIDVASRLHTKEKSAGLPILFTGSAERQAHGRTVAAAEREYERQRKQYYTEAGKHLRNRISDYLLNTAGMADAKRRKGLNTEIAKRWSAIVKKGTKDNTSAFAPWTALVRHARKSKVDLNTAIAVVARNVATDSAAHLVAQELQKEQVTTIQAVADVYAQILRKAADRVPAQGETDKVRAAIAGTNSPILVPRAQALALPIHSGMTALKQLRDHLHQLRFDSPRAVAVADKPKISQGRVYIRGNPTKRGNAVPRRFPALLADERRDFKAGSGRLELAQAIASPENVLTARVIVNRLWYHTFGTALVTSTSDFGLRSSPPSHPRLLDYLANLLIREDWSIKRVQRHIFLSHTYRQSSRPRAECMSVDPENRLLWRMNRKRLSFESMRDALLTSADALDRKIGGRPVATWQSSRRTVYGYINRYRMAAGYTTFDFPSTLRTSPGRQQTLVPQQSLFLMNSPFVRDLARRVIWRPEVANASGHNKIRGIYMAVLGRPPTARELQSAWAFAQSTANQTSDENLPPTAESKYDWDRLAHALFLSNEFLYVD